MILGDAPDFVCWSAGLRSLIRRCWIQTARRDQSAVQRRNGDGPGQWRPNSLHLGAHNLEKRPRCCAGRCGRGGGRVPMVDVLDRIR